MDNTQDIFLTTAELGEFLGLSAETTNNKLTSAGLQKIRGCCRVPTELAEGLTVNSVQTKEGKTWSNLKWKNTVLELL